MNGSLDIVESKINERLSSLSKEICTLFSVFCLLLVFSLEWLLSACGSDTVQWSLHQTSFSVGKCVWPRGCSVLAGSVVLALLGEEELVLGSGVRILGSPGSQWEADVPGVPES